jgi:hypothetical protein
MPEQEVVALRHAAEALLASAGPAAIATVLQTLLAEWQPASRPAPVRPENGGSRTVKIRPSDKIGPFCRENPAWEALRQQVREERTKRSMSNAELATALGMATTTLQGALQVRHPPSGRIQRLLTDWLAAAPEVAADATMFRGNEAGRTDGRTNGAEHANAGA